MAGIAGQPNPRPSDLTEIPKDSALNTYSIPKDSALNSYSSSTLLSDTGSGGGASADPNSAPGIAGQAVDAASRVADYPGGFVRAAGAAAAGVATGQPDVVTKEDLKNAAKGKGPSSAEYLKRLGVSEGASLNLPVLGKVTLRGAEGLALDVMADPLTLIAKSIKTAPYISKILETPGRASEALGQAVYKSAIQGKTAAASTVGDVLIEQGAPIGGAQKLGEKIAQAADTMGNIRQGLFDQFNQLGGKVSIGKDAFKNSLGVIENLKKNPTLRALGESFESAIEKYTAEGFVPIEDMTQWMNQTFDSLPKNAMNGSKSKNVSNMFKSALVEDFRNSIRAAGNKADIGLGDAMIDVNQKWGALLDVSQGGAQGGATSLGKQIDGAVLAAGGVKPYLVKKSFEVATGPYAKTLVGKALMEAGKADVVNRLSRQVLKNVTGQEPQ